MSVLTNDSIERVVEITGDEESYGISFSKIQRYYRAGFAMVVFFRNFWLTLLDRISKLAYISEQKKKKNTKKTCKTQNQHGVAETGSSIYC